MMDKYKNLSEEDKEEIKKYQKNYREKNEKEYFRRKKRKNERISKKS